jgi:hypothetical protein
MAKPPGKRPAKSRGAKPPLARAANGRFASPRKLNISPIAEANSEAEEIRSLARHHTKLALETLADVASTSADEKTRLAAAEALLDRGWGKPAAEKRDAEGARGEQPIVVRVETGIRREVPIDGEADGEQEPD